MQYIVRMKNYNNEIVDGAIVNATDETMAEIMYFARFVKYGINFAPNCGDYIEVLPHVD